MNNNNKIKEISIFLLLFFLSYNHVLFAQSQYDMIVEKKDGSKHYFKVGEIEHVYLKQISEAESYEVWMPEHTTNQFKQPAHSYDTYFPLSYTEFIHQYYDSFIKEYEDGYRVTKKVLGFDSSGQKEIYEYDFCPPNYTKTIMISAGMNPCEIPAFIGLWYFLKFIVDREEAGVSYLHDNVRIKVIPIINPYAFATNNGVTKLGYFNVNGVNLNHNFEYKGNWNEMQSDTPGTWNYKGSGPVSEAEAKVLINWLEDNRNISSLWIDCHTATDDKREAIFDSLWCSDERTKELMTDAQKAILSFLSSIGVDITAYQNTTARIDETGLSYPKTILSYETYGIPSIMIEQIVQATAFGGTNENADEMDINNYVMLLRAYTLAMLCSKNISYVNKMIPVKGGDNIYICTDSYHIIKAIERYNSDKSMIAKNEVNSRIYSVSNINQAVSFLKILVDETNSIDQPFNDLSLYMFKGDGNVVAIGNPQTFPMQLTSNLPYRLFNANRASTKNISVNEGLYCINTSDDYKFVEAALFNDDSFITMLYSYEKDGNTYIDIPQTANNIILCFKRKDGGVVNIIDFDNSEYSFFKAY